MVLPTKVQNIALDGEPWTALPLLENNHSVIKVRH